MAFFHGWRRKTGCVLLVMAAVLTLTWIRSFRVDTTLLVWTGWADWRLTSRNGAFEIHLIRPLSKKWMGAGKPIRWRSQVMSIRDRSLDPLALYDIKHDTKKAGFRYAIAGYDSAMGDPFEWKLLVTPYWPFTAPLTTLSAYLILRPGKRTTKQSRESEPT